MKLHLGCGAVTFKGWINIDKTNKKADMLDDMCVLNGYEPNSIDEIYSSHAIEHISPKDFRQALLKWYALLKPKGMMILRTPNQDRMVQRYPKILTCDEIPKALERMNPHFKHRGDEGYIDRNYFSQDSLVRYVLNAGFVDIRAKKASQRHSVWASFAKYGRDEGIIDKRPQCDLWIKAFKKEEA